MNIKLSRNLILLSSLLLILGLVLAACGAPAAAPAPAPAEEQPAAEAPAAEAPAAEEPAMESKYQEAPMLAQLVAAGELPPVDERLPDEPLHQEVIDQVGQYGGTLRRAFLGPSDHNNYTRLTYDALLRWSPDGTKIIPHIAKGWESTDDFTQWKIFLRPGMKWSDGEPFTAEDIIFWYENILKNEELMPNPPLWIQNQDGSLAQVEMLDDYTVQWTYAEPNTAFLGNIANMDGADKALINLVFVPAHYLKQFHPDFTDKDEVQANAKERGFDTWTELFQVEAFPHTSGNRPSTAAWVPVDGSNVSDQVFRLQRNPYYFAVDPEGKQLPYIDNVTFTFFADKEALNLAAVSGEIDMQGRHLNLSSYPVLKENEDKGNYHVLAWPTFGGSDAVLMFNQTYQNDPAVGEILRNKDFRNALSYAIDRDAIKESVFLGLGEARQSVPPPNHPFYPGDEYAFRATELDLVKANELLDGIGMTERDADGFRMLPGGESLDIEIQVIPAFGNWADVGQIVVEDWADVGVKSHVEIRERALGFQMRDTNDLMVEIWNDDTTPFPFSSQPKQDPRSTIGLTFAPLVRTWYQSNGEEGMEPPPEIKKIVELIDEGKISGPERQAELAQELFRTWTEYLWSIGTVGMTPMIQGVVVVNDNLMNVPETAGNNWPFRTPGNTRPEQYFYTK